MEWSGGPVGLRCGSGKGNDWLSGERWGEWSGGPVRVRCGSEKGKDGIRGVRWGERWEYKRECWDK